MTNYDKHCYKQMVDRLMKEWEQWSKEQADTAAATAVSTAAQLPKSPTAKSDAARAATSLLVEAAPPALTVRGVERDSQISFFVQLMTVMPATTTTNSDCDSSSNGDNSNGHSQHSFSNSSSSNSSSATAKHPVLVYHVCESSVPPWIQLRNGCGTLTGSHADGLIEVEIDASKMEFQERQNGAGWLPVCAMLVVTLEPQETATTNGSTSNSNGSVSSPQHSPKLGGAHAVRRIVVPVVMTLKA
jgi:hypothetical protein